MNLGEIERTLDFSNPGSLEQWDKISRETGMLPSRSSLCLHLLAATFLNWLEQVLSWPSTAITTY